MKKTKLESLYSLLQKKEYRYIIMFNIKNGIEFIQKTKGIDLIHYFLIIGAAYQEIGEIEKADVFFDYYLNLITDNTINNFEDNIDGRGKKEFKTLDKKTKAMAILMYQIQELGLIYKPLK